MDIQGKLLGRPVFDLLGGAVRTSVPISAYSFFKFAAHIGKAADELGGVLSPTPESMRRGRWSRPMEFDH